MRDLNDRYVEFVTLECLFSSVRDMNDRYVEFVTLESSFICRVRDS